MHKHHQTAILFAGARRSDPVRLVHSETNRIQVPGLSLFAVAYRRKNPD